MFVQAIDWPNHYTYFHEVCLSIMQLLFHACSAKNFATEWNLQQTFSGTLRAFEKVYLTIVYTTKTEGVSNAGYKKTIAASSALCMGWIGSMQK